MPWFWTLGFGPSLLTVLVWAICHQGLEELRHGKSLRVIGSLCKPDPRRLPHRHSHPPAIFALETGKVIEKQGPENVAGSGEAEARPRLKDESNEQQNLT